MRRYLALWAWLELAAYLGKRQRAAAVARAAAAYTLPEDGCYTHGTAGCDCSSVVIPIAGGRPHVWRTEWLHSAACWCWKEAAA